MKKGLIIVLSIVVVLLLAVGAAAIIGWKTLDNLHEDSVQVVQKPVEEEVPVEEVKQQDEELTIVEGTPEDVGEDYDVEIDEETAAELEQENIYETVTIDENVINILLVGQDTGLEWNASTRSDSCMILSYNRAEQSVRVVSVMRDTWTRIEGHGWNRINAAYSFGGVGLLINTINDVYDLDIQNYVITGFDEFKKIIDEIGGVDLELTEKEANYLNKNMGKSLEEGMNHLDGAMALAHARNRRTGDGDFGRVARQRNLMLAAFNKVKGIEDVGVWLNLMNFGLNNIRTNMEPKEMITLGLEVLQAENLEIAYGRVPADGTWSYAEKEGKSILSVDFEENAEYLKEFLYGEEEEAEEVQEEEEAQETEEE